MYALGPTGNHLVQSEYDRLTAIYAAVEYRTIDQRTVVVHFDTIGSSRFLTLTHLQYLVLQTALGNNHTLLEFVLSQELLALLLGVTVLDMIECRLDILACRMPVKLAFVTHHAIDKALLDQCEVSNQRRLAHQTVGFLLLDALADLLTHVLELRVTNVFFQTFVNMLDQVGLLGTQRVVQQYVQRNIVAVHQSERVVQRVVQCLESNRFYLARASAFDGFAGFLGRALRSSVLVLEELTCSGCVHHGGVVSYAVNQSLEEQFLVERPGRIVSQAVLLALCNA